MVTLDTHHRDSIGLALNSPRVVDTRMLLSSSDIHIDSTYPGSTILATAHV